MFGKKNTTDKKLLKDIQDWHQLATKVYCYRRDVLEPDQLQELKDKTEELETVADQKPIDPKEAEHAIELLEKILKKCGGAFYPKNFWAENAEMFLVAAILAIGIRTFFFQPFKIPTNSMYPTYNGMTFELFTDEQNEPNIVSRAFRLITLGASKRKIIAPTDGELKIPLYNKEDRARINGYFKSIPVKGRNYIILPTVKRQYDFIVGNENVSLVVPLDFSIDKVFKDRYLSKGDLLPNWIIESSKNGKLEVVSGQLYLNTGISLKKGDPIFSFDILSGDALFVDRISYNFRRPKIGDPFVFRTRNIDGITRLNGGKPDDRYYIKRLVGKGDDVLAVKHPVLYRNGAPIKGVDAFDYNAQRVDEYEGYTYLDRLSVGTKEFIPKNHYYAMGDNSDESSDSRRWGFVPEKSLVGKAIFIYWPFSKRWGPAQ